ncbi:hypothetical protein ONZ45_g9515 [Pleurotus djamor]|nr:hypothetical protein ONZ45_g9515 [Pleurotus djamor]
MYEQADSFVTPCISLSQRRFRSEGNSNKPRKPYYPVNRAAGKPKLHPPRARQTSVEVHDVLAFFEANVKPWLRKPIVRQRLHNFGIPREDAEKLLQAFARQVEDGSFYGKESKYKLERFAQTTNLPFHAHTDRTYMTVMFSWATDPTNRAILEEVISSTTLDLIHRLSTAVNQYYPAEAFPLARNMRRKVIMHVGPTNSGKTHNALRALAAARVGVYAGPLRLLAHEIWERLNLGQIVPLGAENEERTDDLLDDTLDVGDGKPAVHTHGDMKYARQCNLLTGEEQKYVGEYAPLTSATVEMVSYARTYDVAVVDEVQMIADEYRGGGWTNAILGLAAKELHLCGEETAVPLVEAMLKDTGDELIVNRYQRLAPLSVERHSLKGDLRKIRKGDCIVAFSRKGVFGLKTRVEKLTGLRCAVVYGRLPPEVRTSQAALFNDPDSGYDVLIGSDAIGMGLNLKIKRVILEAVHKFDGVQDRALSLSQTKQIAGRAGRYGAHTDGEENVGLVCTVNEGDMGFLRRAVAAPFFPLPYARLSPSQETWTSVASTLPPNSSIQTIIDAHHFCASTQSIYLHTDLNQLAQISDFVDAYASDLTAAEKLTLIMAPIPWRDRSSTQVIGQLMSTYRQQFRVDLLECLSQTKYMDVLQDIEAQMAEGGQPKADLQSLDHLETLHKILVLYLWMSLRHPVTWNSHDDVAAVKGRTEEALGWALEGQSQLEEHAYENPPVRKERAIDSIHYNTPLKRKSQRQPVHHD